MNKGRIAAAGGITLAASLVTGAASADAATTFTVTNTSDAYPAAPAGSLRDAIDQANADASADTIVFASGVTGTIQLQSTLFIQNPVDIQGPGAGTLSVSGQNANRDFLGGSMSAPPNFPVSLSGLTIADGATDASTPTGAPGAGIATAYVDLTLANVVVTGNTVTSDTTDARGGGVAALYGDLTIRNSTISGNSADLPGSGNSYGGGVFTESGVLDVEGSTISGNHADQGGGAAPLHEYSGSAIRNSTISGNQGIVAGGLFLGDDPATVEGSTIAHNTATGYTQLTNHYGGGGVLSYGNPANPVLKNTIVANNTSPYGPDIQTFGAQGDLDSAFSLIGNTSGATIHETVPGSDITGQDPQLGALTDNGGPTQTMAPAATSPVINKGAAFGLSTDQRGLTRPVNFPGIPFSAAAGADGSDIGAVELAAPPAQVLPSNAFSFGKLKKNKKKGTATLVVNLPGPGTLTLSGKGVAPIKRARARLRRGPGRAVGAAGPQSLKIAGKHKTKRKLRKRGKAKVGFAVTFTPTGGLPKTQTKHVTLIKTRH